MHSSFRLLSSIASDLSLRYNNPTPLEYYEHELAQNALYEFLAIGGTPEVVSVFLDKKSYVEASSARKEIYDNYISDGISELLRQ